MVGQGGPSESPGSASIQSEVISDFDIGQTPAGRTLGHRFPSSGRLTFEPLCDDEVSRILTSFELNPIIPSPDGNSFIDALNEDRNLDIKRIHRHGLDGLLINLDGAFGFLSFRPMTPNTVQRPTQRLSLRKRYKYKFKTSIHADETCRCLLSSDRDVLDCVNLCLGDHQLGNTYRYHRNGGLELVHGPEPPRQHRLRKLASNVLDPTKTILDIAAEATSPFPPASAVIKGVLAAHTVKKVSADHRAEAQSELERADELSQNAEKLIQDVQGKQQKDIDRVAQSIIENCGDIKHALLPITKANSISRFLRLNRNKDVIQEARRELDALERRLMYLKDSYLVASVGNLKQDSTSLQTEVARLSKYQIRFLVACF